MLVVVVAGFPDATLDDAERLRVLKEQCSDLAGPWKSSIFWKTVCKITSHATPAKVYNILQNIYLECYSLKTASMASTLLKSNTEHTFGITVEFSTVMLSVSSSGTSRMRSKRGSIHCSDWLHM